jgi:hypothetical protein
MDDPVCAFNRTAGKRSAAASCCGRKRVVECKLELLP